MSKPDLAAVRLRHSKARTEIEPSLPIEAVRVIEMDIPTLLTYIGELENQIERVRRVCRTRAIVITVDIVREALGDD